MESINNLFTNLLNVGVGVGVTVDAFFLMWGAFVYMSAGGSPHQMDAASRRWLTPSPAWRSSSPPASSPA